MTAARPADPSTPSTSQWSRIRDGSWTPWFVVAFLILLAVPLFFDIYRHAAFNTAPRDDYAPFLQSLVGDGGGLPGSPFIYRLFSVAVAIPFDRLLPVYAFSGLTGVDPAYLRATEALAAVSWLSILGTAGVMFLIGRRRLGASIQASALVAALSVWFSAFLSETGVDPIAVLLIGILWFWNDRPILFGALLLASIGFNEKIVVVFGLVFGLRVLLARDRSALLPLLMAVVAAAAYLAVRLIVAAPGNENQLSPGSYLGSVARMIPLMFTLKGAVTNLLPVALIAVLAFVAARTTGRGEAARSLWRWSDALAFLGVLGLALAIDQPGVADAEFTVGRTVMFTFPLYLPLLAPAIDALFPDRGSQ